MQARSGKIKGKKCLKLTFDESAKGLKLSKYRLKVKLVTEAAR